MAISKIERLAGFGFVPAAKGMVRVVLRPHPNGGIELSRYGMQDDSTIQCYNMESLPHYIKYALSAKVEYKFPIQNMPGVYGCVMHIPKEESDALFQTYRP